MSWIRSAINKAAEVPGGAIFRAAVRTYTDSVVQHAGYSLSGSDDISPRRIDPKKIQNSSDVAKRLEEVSVSCKGEERVKLLKRWLLALREVEKLNGSQAEIQGKISEDPRTLSDKNVTPRKTDMILHHDPDLGSVPMNFRDIFLQSRALEGMTMSMILVAPNDEEIVLLHDIFGLCLTGGKEVHDVVVKSIQDMAKAFSVYDNEMLVRREELLQLAKTAVTGLKATADVARVDSEISQIQQSLNELKRHKSDAEGSESYSEATKNTSSMDTKDSVAHIQLCCRLKFLLLKKRLLKKGDTPETHAQKVDKLKVLLESLQNSAYKTEKRVLEHREQQKEIHTFCLARTSGVSQIEKSLEAEISVIEKQRDKLEAELRQVNSTLVAAITRLQNAREERLQFDEDNDEFFSHLKEKEDELSKTIVSYRAEADACNTFINFLECTWAFQTSFVNQRDKQVNDQLQNHEAYVVNVVTSFLSTYKDQLEPAIANLRKLLQNLKGYQYMIDPDDEFLHDIKQRVNTEQEYLDAEAKVTNIFNAVDSIKEHFYSAVDNASRDDVEVINKLCNAIEKLKQDFKINKRPTLQIEIPTNEDILSPTTGSPRGVTVLSPVRAMPDFKSIFSQNLLTKSPRKKPYIPLGGSSDTSPVSTVDSDTKSTENKQHRLKTPESEKPSHLDKHVSNPFSNKENKTSRKGPLGYDKESREQLPVLVSQESKMHEYSTVDLDKESVTSAAKTNNGINTETMEGGLGETSDASTAFATRDLCDKESMEPLPVSDIQESNMHEYSTLCLDKELMTSALEKETGMKTETTERELGGTSKPSTDTDFAILNLCDKESTEQLPVLESQESKLNEYSSLNLDKELVTSALEKETGMNTETTKRGLGETSEVSTDFAIVNLCDKESREQLLVSESQERKVNEYSSLDHVNELVTSALEKETGMNTVTTERGLGETSEASTDFAILNLCDKESRKQLPVVFESQESKVNEYSSLDLVKDSVASALEKETCMNTVTTERGLGETSEASTDFATLYLCDKEGREQLPVSESQESKMNDYSSLDLDKELVTSSLEKETGMNTETTERGLGGTSETSTEEDFSGSKNKKSVDPIEKQSKSISGSHEKDQVCTEDIVGWKFDETVKEHKDDNHHHNKSEIRPSEDGGFDSKQGTQSL